MVIGVLALMAAEPTQEFSIFGAMLREWYLVMPLVAASIAIVVIGVERFLFVRKASEQAAALKEQLGQMSAGGAKSQDLAAAAEQGFSSAMYRALYEGSFHPQVTVNAMERARTADIAACKRGLWFIGSMGNLAPFFGLFGTVIGIIQAFIDIAKTGSGGFATVSAGISTALVTTAAGIFVGIMAVFVFNYLNVLIGKLGATLKSYGEEAYEARLLKLSQQARATASAGAPARRATDLPAHGAAPA